MNTLKVGWAEIDITTEKKVSLTGQFAERISEYVEKPLTATVMAIECNGEQAVFVSCDLAVVSRNLVEDIRVKLSGNSLGLDPKKIIFNAIHTHTGPGYPVSDSTSNGGTINSLRRILEGFLAPGQKYVEREDADADPTVATGEEVYALLLERLPKVILQAWEGRKSGSFVNAFGRAAVGMCRRAVYSDGSAKMWGDTNSAVFEALEGGNDSGMELLYFFDEKKEVTGIVVNLACPAQCVQHRSFVSPDFWGEVKVRLRAYFGEHIFLLPQCSAAGDQCPVDLVRWVEPDSDLNDPNISQRKLTNRKADPSMFDLQGMRKTGKRIASEVIDVWEEGLDIPQDKPEFIHEVKIMQLPLRRASLTDLEQAKQGIREYLSHVQGNVDYNDIARLQIYMGVLKRFELQEEVETVDTEVHIIRLGDIAFATNPFELFLDYGNQIKARSHASQTFLIQLANGGEGYLPTKKAEQGGHYSAFIASGQVGHAGGEQLVRETLQEINRMFNLSITE